MNSLTDSRGLEVDVNVVVSCELWRVQIILSKVLVFVQKEFCGKLVVFHLNMDSKNFLNVVSSESSVNFFSCSLKITEET